MKRKQNDAIGLVKRVISGDKDAIKEVLASIPRLIWKPSENCLPLEANVSHSEAPFSPDMSEDIEYPKTSEVPENGLKMSHKEYLKQKLEELQADQKIMDENRDEILLWKKMNTL